MLVELPKVSVAWVQGTLLRGRLANDPKPSQHSWCLGSQLNYVDSVSQNHQSVRQPKIPSSDRQVRSFLKFTKNMPIYLDLRSPLHFCRHEAWLSKQAHLRSTRWWKWHWRPETISARLGGTPKLADQFQPHSINIIALFESNCFFQLHWMLKITKGFLSFSSWVSHQSVFRTVLIKPNWLSKSSWKQTALRDKRFILQHIQALTFANCDCWIFANCCMWCLDIWKLQLSPLFCLDLPDISQKESVSWVHRSQDIKLSNTKLCRRGFHCIWALP